MVSKKLIVLGAAVFVLLATLFIALLQPEKVEVGGGYVEPIKGGRAGPDGYFVFFANGSGSTMLVALNERPKTSVVVLREEGIDQETNERFEEFVEGIEAVEDYGIGVDVVTAANLRGLRETVVIIPNGAMPKYVLEDLESLHSRGNRIIYIGKTNFVLSRELEEEQWLARLDNASRSKIIVKETKLGDFLDAEGAMDALRSQIVKNDWAKNGEADFTFSGFSGHKTLFVPLEDRGYYRFIYSAEGGKGIVDSPMMLSDPIQVRVSLQDMYSWESSELYYGINQSAGRVIQTIEKDAKLISTIDQGYVGSYQVKYVNLENLGPGDYIFRVYDNSGTLASAHVHVKKIEIKIVEVRDVRVLFNVTVDGVPVKSDKATVSLGGEEGREFSISDGQMAVPARLKTGENNFYVKYLAHSETITYTQTQEGLLETYAKWLLPGLAIIIIVYVFASMRRKPVYTLRIEKMGKKRANSLWVSPEQIVDAIKDVEKNCGWKDVPISLKELMQSFKKNITDGADMFDGDVESLMKRMEELGHVERYGDYYQLRGWGDIRKNVIKRRIRDALVLSGEKFRSAWGGFELDRFIVSTEYFNTDKNLILVFEDEEEKRMFLEMMEPLSRAEIELKLENGKVTITTLDGLSEFI